MGRLGPIRPKMARADIIYYLSRSCSSWREPSCLRFRPPITESLQRARAAAAALLKYELCPLIPCWAGRQSNRDTSSFPTKKRHGMAARGAPRHWGRISGMVVKLRDGVQRHWDLRHLGEKDCLEQGRSGMWRRGRWLTTRE